MVENLVGEMLERTFRICNRAKDSLLVNCNTVGNKTGAIRGSS
jgi:hypothetical protein